MGQEISASPKPNSYTQLAGFGVWGLGFRVSERSRKVNVGILEAPDKPARAALAGEERRQGPQWPGR